MIDIRFFTAKAASAQLIISNIPPPSISQIYIIKDLRIRPSAVDYQLALKRHLRQSSHPIISSHNYHIHHSMTDLNIEEEEWIKQSLIEHERQRCISKVLSVDCEDAVAKGNNYSSDMHRLTLKLVLNSGELIHRKYIYKAMPKTEVRLKMIKDFNLNIIESRMFTEVLPEIERIRQEKEPGVERISPICYGVMKNHSGYLMEDLVAIGYKMADRTIGLNFEEAKVVMKTYAQLHAGSLVLIERGEVNLKDFSEHAMRQNPDMFNALCKPALTDLAKEVEEKWGEEWSSYPERIRELSTNLVDRLMKCIDRDERNINIISHGDAWTTNMMFRYNEEGHPVHVRLLDFQASHYNNAGLDLQHFFHASLDAAALSRKEELLRVYYEQLASRLILYEYSGHRPTLEEVTASYDRAGVMGLVIGLITRPLLMRPVETVPDNLEDFAKDIMDMKGMNADCGLEQLRPIFQIILRDADKKGLL